MSGRQTSSDGVAFGCGDLDGSVGQTGDGVAGFFDVVVPGTGGQAVELVGGPAPGRGSQVVDVTAGGGPVTAGPVALISGQLDAEPDQTWCIRRRRSPTC